MGRTTHGAVLLAMPNIRLDTHVWFNPELKSRYYFVPGVLVNIIMIVTLILTALSIVREKEIGTMAYSIFDNMHGYRRSWHCRSIFVVDAAIWDSDPFMGGHFSACRLHRFFLLYVSYRASYDTI